MDVSGLYWRRCGFMPGVLPPQNMAFSSRPFNIQYPQYGQYPQYSMPQPLHYLRNAPYQQPGSRIRRFFELPAGEQSPPQAGYCATPLAHQAHSGPVANERRSGEHTILFSGSSSGSSTLHGVSPNIPPLPVPELPLARASTNNPATNFWGPSAFSLGPDTRLCVACAEQLPEEDFSESTLTQSCSHTNSACKECVKQWIETQLSNGTWENLKCLECDEMMQYPDVQRHAEGELFQKYDTLVARSWLSNEEEFVWCRNQNCGSGQLHIGGTDAPRFRCVSCGAQYCIVHEVPWHEEETCTDFDARMHGRSSAGNGATITAPAPPSDTQLQERRRRVIPRSAPRPTTTRQDERVRRWLDESGQTMTYTGTTQPFDDDMNYSYDYPMSYTETRTQQHTSGYLPRPSREWAPQIAVARAAMPKFQNQPSRSRNDAMRDVWDEQRQIQPRLYAHDPRDNPMATALSRTQGFSNSGPVPDHDYIYAPKLSRYRYSAQNDREIVWNTGMVTQQREQPRRQPPGRQIAPDSFQHERAEREEREAYQRRKAEEKQGEAKVRQVAKQCPKCKWFIEKNNGCDHMTCFKCKHEFCWLCLVSYQKIRDGSNAAHLPSCRDYRRDY